MVIGTNLATLALKHRNIMVYVKRPIRCNVQGLLLYLLLCESYSPQPVFYTTYGHELVCGVSLILVW